MLTPWKPAKDGLRHYSEELFTQFHKDHTTTRLRALPWNYTKKRSRLLLPVKDYPKHLFTLLFTDVLHIQYIAGLYLWHLFPLLFFAKLLRKKVIFTLHELNDNATGKALLTIIQKLYLLFADALIVHTVFHKNKLPKHLQRKVRVIPHASPNLQATHRLKAKKDTVLLAGFINPWKGYDLAIKALAILKDKLPTLTMTIVGKAHDPSYAKQLESLIKEQGLTKRIDLITDFIPKQDLEHHFCKAGAVLLPYRRITMSGILANAIGAKRPMIMTNLEPFKEHTLNGCLYFKKDDADDLAQKIYLLLSDKNIYQEQERAAENLYEHYSLKHVAQLTKHLYDTLS
jgi:glycosyltransferase involved in cell wall biosynthesis